MIQLDGIRVALQRRPVLRGVSLDVRAGEVVALAGPNGAGKSTLLRVACGERVPDDGTVTLGGRPLQQLKPEQRSRLCAVLPQRSALTFPFTVREVVELGRSPHRATATRVEDERAVTWAMESTGILALGERRYPELSGGEQQRVQLARVLAQLDPPGPERASRWLFLDEPVAGLDPAQQHGVLALARRVAKRGIGVLAVLHDLNLAAQYADRIAVLREGALRADGPPAVVLTRELVAEAFELDVRVVPHPCLDCPLLVPEARAHSLAADRLAPV